ncbi:unnamed protein product [Caenorhabditis bovis]|uniref:Uncharacterized protein n=1 Tax=Caenorhabditis bovis TaxID=2654633 RepID=A0A8S1FAI3_9PELO|nr:unnamed protein product [Caenorhabditis bovis]
MLLQRSIILIDSILLLSIFAALLFWPAHRCATIEVEQYENPCGCLAHPIFRLETDFRILDEPTRHETSICHTLQWKHYAFWKNLYMIVLPAASAILLAFLTFIELWDLSLYRGYIQSGFLIGFSLLSVIYTMAVIAHEKSNIETEFYPAQVPRAFGALSARGVHEINAPGTWKYSILACLASAALKIARILVQHFFGDVS